MSCKRSDSLLKMLNMLFYAFLVVDVKGITLQMHLHLQSINPCVDCKQAQENCCLAGTLSTLFLHYVGIVRGQQYRQLSLTPFPVRDVSVPSVFFAELMCFNAHLFPSFCPQKNRDFFNWWQAVSFQFNPNLKKKFIVEFCKIWIKSSHTCWGRNSRLRK